MNDKLLRKNPKPIVLPICLQNVESVSPNATIFTLSNSHKKLLTAFPSTLFKSDLPLFNNKKADEKPVSDFL